MTGPSTYRRVVGKNLFDKVNIDCTEKDTRYNQRAMLCKWVQSSQKPETNRCQIWCRLLIPHQYNEVSAGKAGASSATGGGRSAGNCEESPWEDM